MIDQCEAVLGNYCVILRGEIYDDEISPKNVQNVTQKLIYIFKLPTLIILHSVHGVEEQDKSFIVKINNEMLMMTHTGWPKKKNSFIQNTWHYAYICTHLITSQSVHIIHIYSTIKEEESLLPMIMLRPVSATFPVSKQELPISQPVWF